MNNTGLLIFILATLFFLNQCGQETNPVKCLEWEENGMYGPHRSAECVRWK